MEVGRRELLRIAGIGAAALGTGALSSGCAATTGFVINAAWFETLTAALGANVLAYYGTKWTDTAAGFVAEEWKGWHEGSRAAVVEQKDQGYPWHGKRIFGDSLPPAAMFYVCRNDEKDPATDRFVVIVDGGAKRVVFEPWAWQALGMFAVSMTAEKEGDDLAVYRTLVGMALTPSGVAPNMLETPSGRSQLLSYEARHGTVEMNFSTDGAGKSTVQVTAFGIKTASGSPTVKSFELPKLEAKTAASRPLGTTVG